MESLTERSDEELALLVQGKNMEAFGVLMSRYRPKLMRYGSRFLAREEQVEDAVQEVFIKAYQNILSFDATRPFSPWIYRIAHNAFINALRALKREPVIFLDFDTLLAHPSYERDPADEEERATLRAQLDVGLAQLSPKYREILVLYYLEDLSYPEIADVLEVPIGTVGIRLKRAREALKKYVKS